MVAIDVINANGRTCDVHISWVDFTHSRGKTNSEGRISFHVSSGAGSILVDGREVYKGNISGVIRVKK